MKMLTFSPDGTENCTVTAMLQQELTEAPQRKHPVAVICPGGGYGFVSQREGIPVAKKYFNVGYSCFVLDYSVNEAARDFGPLKQLAATVAHIRSHGEELHIDPNKIAVIGFSAGGHLACSLGVLHNDPKFLKAWGREENIRPNAMVLSYPVITADEYAHKGSILNVSGAEEGSPEYNWWGLHTHVDKDTPPTFLWHTAADDCVPVENSLIMATALSGAKVPFELHIFPEGCHGLSVCNQEVGTPHPYNGRWVDMSIAWLNITFDFSE